MEFLFDTANLDDIKRYHEIYPITGVTSNPSIIKKEGKIDFFAHFKKIRAIIGIERSLHVQITADDFDTMLKEADAILTTIDDKVYIKIPTTEEGLRAMRTLKQQGVGVTATAIYTKIQAYLAMEAEADFIAPYYNRMENMDICAEDSIACMARQIALGGYQTKILAASFKNVAQVNAAFAAGAHTATLAPELLHEALNMAAIGKAVTDFKNDWINTFGDVNITQL